MQDRWQQEKKGGQLNSTLRETKLRSRKGCREARYLPHFEIRTLQQALAHWRIGALAPLAFWCAMVASGSAHELLTIWEVADWIPLGDAWLTKLTRVTSANEGIERSHQDPPVGRGRDKHRPTNRREFRERVYWSASAATKAVISVQNIRTTEKSITRVGNVPQR